MDPSTENRVAAVADPPNRDRAIDVAKGLAIIAIVVGHVWRGMGSAGVLAGWPTVYEEVDTALYAVHLPVFAFLAGIFIQRSIAKYGTRAFLARRATEFLWLYLLWTILQGLVRLVLAEVTNHPMTPSGFVRSFWLKDSQLWFLPFLLIVTVLVTLVRPWRTVIGAVTTTLVAVAVGVGLWGLDIPWVGAAGIQLLPFFWIGTLIGPERFSALWTRLSWWTVAAAGAMAAGAVLVFSDPATSTWSAHPRTPMSVLGGVVAATAGAIAVLALARGLRSSRILTVLGRRSLEIFLAHIMATAGCRVVLLTFGITSWPVHVILGTICGLTFPLALLAVAQRIHVRWLFGLPTSRAVMPNG